MTPPTFKVSNNNLPTATGAKRKKTKNRSSTTPKKSTKESDSAANFLSPTSYKAAITIVDWAKTEEGKDSNESATKFATGNGNIIDPSVQTPKLVATTNSVSVSESTAGRF